MVRALRAARRRHLPYLQAKAHHHLFHLSTEAGQLVAAYEHARSALDGYSGFQPDLTHLAHDVARYWLHLGRFERALPILQGVRGHLDDPEARLLGLGNLTRALAGVGDRCGYEKLRGETAAAAASLRGRAVAEAYEALAHADLSMGEWELAEADAGRALAGATALGQADVRLTAEAQLENARAHRGVDQHVGTESPRLAGEARRLAEAFRRVLSVIGC
jgi:tetratricopeptide (TPR) repeat protein